MLRLVEERDKLKNQRRQFGLTRKQIPANRQPNPFGIGVLKIHKYLQILANIYKEIQKNTVLSARKIIHAPCT